MTASIAYPYYVERSDKAYILLWLPMADGDQFRKRTDGSIFVARSRSEIETAMKEGFFDVIWNESASFDVDDFMTKLRGLREGRASSAGTCKVLLDGWNLTDDLLRTLSRTDLLEESRSGVLKKAYDKIFYGTNLEAITPPEASYSPLWSKAEIEGMKEYVQKSWRVLADVFPK